MHHQTNRGDEQRRYDVSDDSEGGRAAPSQPDGGCRQQQWGFLYMPYTSYRDGCSCRRSLEIVTPGSPLPAILYYGARIVGHAAADTSSPQQHIRNQAAGGGGWATPPAASSPGGFLKLHAIPLPIDELTEKSHSAQPARCSCWAGQGI